MRKRIFTVLAALGIALAGLGVNPIPSNAGIAECGGNITADLYTGWNYDMIGAQYKKRFCGDAVNAIAVPNLGAYVGMNNSVSSFKTFNMPSTRGIRFYDGTSYTGDWVQWCGNRQIPNIGTMDNRISSLKSVNC